ncbi:hypothetical protein F3J37_21510 [Pantoea sp. Al-1710]|uniref:Uncharacterized protein n=1 Tax=Candidatus Pantoea communis TaxID=2608354 RepID=A0ABX0RWC2_9GAMM|nr:hypothetical protein [Pantoea communis]NIG21257.1 hypothetical protein [Pantoea communis]
MIVVLSGEGPSDLGSCTNRMGECTRPEFSFGPMTYFVDKELKGLMNFSMLDTTPDRYIFVAKPELIRLAGEQRQNRKSMSLQGKKNSALETGYFYRNAKTLGNRSVELAAEYGDDSVIAVLFRDCDGTRSADASLWQDKVNSIQQGFHDSKLGGRGVAMVPKPKSESWMLCVLRDNYQHCTRLEDLSGNDNAINSAKMQLEEALGGDASTASQINYLEDRGIDTDLLASVMPSYDSFHQNMINAYQEANRLGV